MGRTCAEPCTCRVVKISQRVKPSWRLQERRSTISRALCASSGASCVLTQAVSERGTAGVLQEHDVCRCKPTGVFLHQNLHLAAHTVPLPPPSAGIPRVLKLVFRHH